MLTETILRWVTEYGYIGIFSLLALGIIGTPIPDEGVLAFAGYLVYEGKMQLFSVLAAAFLGSACGITLSYGLDAPWESISWPNLVIQSHRRR